MFKMITPEEAGISSRAVTKFLRKLEERGEYMHGVLLMRGENVFSECYWAPYNRDSIHRMYSQSKSFVGIAIGLLEEEGKLNLDDPLADYFPERLHKPLHPWLASQTIRQTLLMETTGRNPSWFLDETAVDRTEFYFRTKEVTHPAGTFWQYDSPGSQVLCSLVEKLSGKPLLDYLKEKLFNHMGSFQTAKMLKTRNDDTFGDSAMICTLRDMASVGRLLMQGGVYNGKRLMNEGYIREATSNLIDNDENGYFENFHVGYGYHIWQAPRGGFAFVGMGAQMTICLPQYDFLFACTADAQGHVGSSSEITLILTALYDFIVDELQENPLPPDGEAYGEYLEYTGNLQLKHLPGRVASSFADAVNGVTYLCDKNHAGITEFSLHFGEDQTGEFHYTNAQGKKVLPFGLGKNVFGKFPQLGYSQEHAAVPTTDGSMYDCAASAAWREERKLMLKVQIIDDYIGNFVAIFCFWEGGCTVRMEKSAEAFLTEYRGIINAVAKP